MEQGPTQGIVTDYRARLALYGSFGTKLAGLISELLQTADLTVHSVTHRTKDETSLVRKLSGADGAYKALSDVTDICGVRIITYFADEVDAVAKLIEREFTIDPENSIDKRAALDPDQFGYLSVHYIVSLTPMRLGLGEYSLFKELWAEIQIRSILQHAWAEIEHDLGYKSNVAIPRDVRRQFSRLAGLLEIADEGFSTLRRDLSHYAVEVDRKIEARPEDLDIDSVSLKALIESDPVIKRVDASIGAKDGPGDTDLSGLALANFVNWAKALGFKNIGELKSAIAVNASRLERFTLDFWRLFPATMSRGISVFYFLMLMAMDQGGPPLTTKVLGFPASFYPVVQKAYDLSRLPQS